MGRMAMAANMAEMRPVSTCCGLPQFDRIAFGIVDPRETADPLHFLDLGHVDARLAKPLNQFVEPFDAQIDHPLLVGGEIAGVRSEWREDGGPRLLLPHPIIAAAHTEMLAIPALERVRVLCPEEQSANSSYRHNISPVMKSAGAPATPGPECPRRDSRARRRPEVRAPTG